MKSLLHDKVMHRESNQIQKLFAEMVFAIHLLASISIPKNKYIC